MRNQSKDKDLGSPFVIWFSKDHVEAHGFCGNMTLASVFNKWRCHWNGALGDLLPVLAILEC